MIIFDSVRSVNQPPEPATRTRNASKPGHRIVALRRRGLALDPAPSA